MDLLPYALPWYLSFIIKNRAIFLVLSVIGWFCYCICCGLDKCCPPFKCCRRDLENRKYNECERNWPLFLGLLTTLLVLGTAIAGYFNNH